MSQSLAKRVVDLAAAIQQIPAPTFSEQRRAAFICERFRLEDLSEVSVDKQANVYACLPGQAGAPALIVSAHSDTVFPEPTDLTLRREGDILFGPGIGDNCLGVAGLFGLLWALRQKGVNLPGDLWLVANTCEEGLGDLRGMRAVVDRFGDRVLAYIILEGMALGQVYHRGLGVQRYRISVHTAGGHSWVDYGKPSAIHELALLINQVLDLQLAKHPRTTLNVGVISGGTTVNTIASDAVLQLDLRSESARVLSDLASRVEKLVHKANRPNVQVVAEVIGRRPVGRLSSQHALVRLAKRCLEDQGIHDVNLGIGSTDANVPLSRGLPAVCVGISKGGNAHTLNEYIDTKPVAQGLGQLLALVEGVFRESGSR
jgi:tripeptide aminopeptidase